MISDIDLATIKASVSIVQVIGETLQLRRDGRLHVALCPFHGERSPSFTVYNDHYHCFGCGARGDVFDWLRRTRRMSFQEAVRHLGSGGHGRAAAAPIHPVAPADRENPKTVEIARRIWIEAVPPQGSPVERYLASRRVSIPDAPVVRYHPRCPRERDELPAMVALMADPVTGQPCGVHRTFLRPDGSGKAPVDRPKMMLGVAGVIRLAEPEGEGLGLAEGVETALSVSQIFTWGPCWAAGSAGGIARFPVLPRTSLTIFSDSDAAGLKAARECGARWTAAGHEALIHIPPEGQDWADAARRIAA